MIPPAPAPTPSPTSCSRSTAALIDALEAWRHAHKTRRAAEDATATAEVALLTYRMLKPAAEHTDPIPLTGAPESRRGRRAGQTASAGGYVGRHRGAEEVMR